MIHRWYFFCWVALYGCQSRGEGGAPRPTAAASSSRPSRALQDTSAVSAQLALAEQRRDSAAIGGEALSSRDVTVRRAAARALSRIADARAVELLSLALADEDPEVGSFAAYGLGYACRGREVKVVHALTARAAALAGLDVAASSPPRSPPLATPLWGAEEAISDALGRCAGPEAEGTLRAWLRGPKPRAEAAALALGHVAEHSGKLNDETIVTLLDAADQDKDPLYAAFYPLTRLPTLNASSEERVLTLAQRTLNASAPGAEFALRALARTGQAGQAVLAKLCADPAFPAGLRAQAARELGALGPAGQAGLWAAFAALGVAAASDEKLASAEYGVLTAVVDALAPPVMGAANATQALVGLCERPIAPADSDGLRRRKVHLRCAAAALLSGKNYGSARLAACDPAGESEVRDLAVVAVLGRDALRGSRKQAYLQRATGKDCPAREAALELLLAHPELDEAPRVLSAALSSKSLGVVASAAHVLSSYPERANRVRTSDAHAAPSPDASVVQALASAYAAAERVNSIEVQSLLLDAIGALQVLGSKDAVNAACRSDNPSLREHAQRTLRLLGEQTRRCDAFTGSATALSEAAASGRVRLAFDTDAPIGNDAKTPMLTLTLDPSYAPVAVQRIAQLAESGFYDGLVVHRVVPGFVAQFGDPEADGYGGDAAPPLRCETSPVSFSVGSVGIALSGRDTGSSQFFVTLGRYPHLDGQYTWIGEAGPGWERLTAGDRVRQVRPSALP